MKVLARRGTSSFIVELDKKQFALVSLTTKKITKEESPDVFYRFGYCEEPNCTDDELSKIEELLKQ
jgi:hypothetical protein